MSLACGESSSRSWRLIRIEASSGETQVALVERSRSWYCARRQLADTQHLLIKALESPHDIMQTEQWWLLRLDCRTLQNRFFLFPFAALIQSVELNRHIVEVKPGKTVWRGAPAVNWKLIASIYLQFRMENFSLARGKVVGGWMLKVFN